MVIFSPDYLRTVLVLGYTSYNRTLDTYLSKIISAIFLWQVT